MISAAPRCEGCEYGNVATRRIRLEPSSHSERNSCELCFEARDRPETIVYIYQDCGSETPSSYRLCTTCSVIRGLRIMRELLRSI